MTRNDPMIESLMHRFGRKGLSHGSMARSAVGVGLAGLAVGIAVLALSAPAHGAGSNPLFASGTPSPQTPLTTSTGVASAPWADPYCPPSEGTQSTDQGVAPGSWASLLGQALLGSTDQSQITDVVQNAVDMAWSTYTQQAGMTPPGFATLTDAESLLEGKAIGAILDQNNLDGLVLRIADITKPT